MRGFSTELDSMLLSPLAGQNQEIMDLNVGPALNGDMVATAVGSFFSKNASWNPLRGFSMELDSMLLSPLAGQNQEIIDLNVGPALNGDMVATAVGQFSSKFESWDPPVCN